MANGSYALVELKNGTRSIHSRAERETFHPVIGPAAEARALYVEQLRLRERLARTDGEFVLWDVGLGAAANVLTVLAATRDLPAPLRILSFDRTLEPLAFAREHAESLGYFADYGTRVERLLEDRTVTFNDGGREVNWSVQVADFPGLIASPAAAVWPKPHAILFDAFSPAKNPDMWTLPLFARMFQLLDPARPCAMPTYSRSTLLRVTWLLAGFHVGFGDATGEKEQTTLAANRPELIRLPLGHEWLDRARRSTSAEPLRDGIYGQRPLQPDTWEQLQRHPQFHRPATTR